jgi:hypothetical protein
MNTSLRSFFSREINTMICNVKLSTGYYAQFVTTSNFIYLYYGIVHNRHLSKREYILMQTTLMSITGSFFIWDYFLTVPTDDTEFVMTEEYMEIFGGRILLKTENYELVFEGIW